MNLGKLIHTLLKRQTEVYVKGLGVFKRIYTPATFDAKKNVFLPPITFIEFDSRSAEGYDFVSYVQQMKQNDRLEAEQEVDVAIHSIVEQLNQKGQAKLDDLGYLVSYGDSYVFKAIDLSGFNYESMEDKFYLPADEEPKPIIEEFSREEIVITNPPVEESKDTEGQLTAPEEPMANLIPVSTKMEELPPEDEEVQMKSNKAMWYGLVAMLAILILGGIYYYSVRDMNKKESPTVVLQPVDVVTPEILIDTNQVMVEQDTLTPNDSDSLDMLMESEEPPPTPKHMYQIVIGSHRTLAQAYQQAEAFHKDGHKRVKVVSPNLAHNRKKVVWDTYETKQEMDSALNYVQKHIIADAWPDKIR